MTAVAMVSCDICGKQLKTRQALASHIRFKHGTLLKSLDAAVDAINEIADEVFSFKGARPQE
ncbi:hypothetical protein ES703_104188 [subsurface metagenome]